MNTKFHRLLERRQILLADGATGTNLFNLGLVSGDSPEFWNRDYPERVVQHYQSFIDAGSDIILTNTFGGTRYRLKLHGGEDHVSEFNQAGARILADTIAQQSREIIVAGCMGPTGEILEPNGMVSIEDASNAFAEQALALQQGGADIIWIETLSSLEECQAAVQGASQTGLPIVLTMSIDTNGRTMMGVSPADIVKISQHLMPALAAYGTNCGLGASEVIAALVNMQQSTQAQDIKPILIAKGNCGIPQWDDGKIIYSGTPELMSKYATMAMDAGARIIGGCCGTTPSHIAAMRKAIDNHQIGSMPDIDAIQSILGEVTTGSAAQMAGDFSVSGGSVSGTAKSRSGRRRRRQSSMTITQADPYRIVC